MMMQVFPKFTPYYSCTAMSSKRYTISDVKNFLGIAEHTAWIEMEQIHSDGVAVLDSNFTELHPLKGVDAFVSLQSGCYAIRTADCLPIIIMNEDLVAGIHAGRRGTEKKILKKTMQIIKKFTQKKLYIWMGPCICYSCYEIDFDTGMCYDLRSNNLSQLKDSLPGRLYNLYSSPYCTKCLSATFFSYRSGDLLERNYSVVSR